MTTSPKPEASGASLPARPGRKREHSRDAVILDSTLAVLAERGYDGMTIDLVAAHAGMARATVYRRWPSKADLVLDAVSRLSQGDVDAARLPDTGTLRGDMVAMIRPFDDEQQQVRIQAMVSLLAVAHADHRLAEVTTSAGLRPWIDAIGQLIRRAVDRGEYPPPGRSRHPRRGHPHAVRLPRGPAPADHPGVLAHADRRRDPPGDAKKLSRPDRATIPRPADNHREDTTMTITTTAHANFRGQAREALTYYQSVFGGELALATYADIHSAETPETADHIAFGRLTAADGFDLMGYDVQPSKGYDPGQNAFYLNLQGTDAHEITARWDRLADNAQAVLIPLGPAPFAPLYGMLTDRYGITWIVGVEGQ